MSLCSRPAVAGARINIDTACYHASRKRGLPELAMGSEHTLQGLVRRAAGKSHDITHVLRARTACRWYCARPSTNRYRSLLEATVPIDTSRRQNSNGAR